MNRKISTYIHILMTSRTPLIDDQIFFHVFHHGKHGNGFARHGKRLEKRAFHTFQSPGCHNSMTWFEDVGESIRSRRSATSRPSAHKVPAPPRCVASERGVPQRHAPGTVRVLRVWSRLPFRSEVSYWIRKFCFHK